MLGVGLLFNIWIYIWRCTLVRNHNSVCIVASSLFRKAVLRNITLCIQSSGRKIVLGLVKCSGVIWIYISTLSYTKDKQTCAVYVGRFSLHVQIWIVKWKPILERNHTCWRPALASGEHIKVNRTYLFIYKCRSKQNIILISQSNTNHVILYNNSWTG